MAERKFSELPSAASLTGNELAALSQMQSGSLASVKSTLQAIANWFAVYAQYTTALQTTDKSIAGAINELKQLISLIPQFSIEVVQVLPTEDISDTTIYLVPAEDPEVGNYYEEYIHVNNTWELVGTTAVDLSAYYTKLEVDAKFSALATVATSGSYNDLTNKPDLSALMDVNETAFTNPYTKKLVPSGKYTEKLKKLIGASVVWNQLVKNGNFADTSEWQMINASLSVSGGIGTFTSSSTNMAIYQSRPERNVNHIYRIVFEHSVDSGTQDVILYWGSSSVSTVTASTTKTRVEKIIKITTESANVNLNFAVNGIGSGGKYNISAVQLTDLTAMFNSPIADRAYTLEQAQAGSGIAWLQSYGFFLDAYNAYTAGGLQSVSLAAKANVWKNLLNPNSEIINAYITAAGKVGAGTYDRTLIIPCFPNTNYVFKWNRVAISQTTDNSMILACSEKPIVGTSGRIVGNSITTNPMKFTTNATENWLAIKMAHIQRTDLTETIKASQLEIGTAATPYEPYTEITYPLDHTELRGLFKLDANNNLYADGDEYNADGSGSEEFDVGDLGDLSWSKGTNTFYAAVTSLMPKLVSQPQPLIAEGYSAPNIDTSEPDSSWASSVPDMSIAYHISSSSSTAWYIYIKDTAKLANMTADQFKTAVTGLKFVYKKATPTTATLTPYEKLQLIEQGGTEEFIDYGVQSSTRDVAIPAGNETAYGDNENMGKIINYMNT